MSGLDCSMVNYIEVALKETWSVYVCVCVCVCVSASDLSDHGQV